MTLVPPNSNRGGYPLGLTGAVSATRYVGATAAGAPASGTFAVGDFVVAQDGTTYVCTVAGTPGTWVNALRAALAYLTVQTGVPVAFTTPLVYDNTAVTGGLYAWSGVAYAKIGGLAS